MAGGCSSSSPLPSIRVDSISSDFCVGSTVQAQKCGLRSGSAGSISPVSPVHSFKSTFSRSSVFCTNLYQSSSTTSEAHQLLGNLPFLPHPPVYNRSTPPVDSTNSSSLYTDDIGSQGDEKDSEEVIVKDLLSLSGDSSEGSFHGLSCTNDKSVLAEHLELQYLSDELDIIMIDNGESPKLDVSMFPESLPHSPNQVTSLWIHLMELKVKFLQVVRRISFSGLPF